MLRHSYSSILLQLLGASLYSSRVLAANCTSVTITSVADADTLRQNCPTVSGTVTIGPFNETTVQDINLDGVKVIQGDFKTAENGRGASDIPSGPFAISSSTLQLVEGNIYFFQDSLHNLSLPNLTAVHEDFYVWESPVTYLDITSLESAGWFSINAENLTTLHHTKLTNVTDIEVYPVLLDSVDSVLNNAIDIASCTVQGPFPNMDTITIGFTNVFEKLSIDADLNVTLGGSSTAEMNLKRFKLAGNSTGLTRSSTLESLTVNQFQVTNTFMNRLYVDFDDLEYLGVLGGDDFNYLEEIQLPPKAVDWTGGFKLILQVNGKVNLTSQYTIDDAGNQIQTWYWPTNISSIEIDDALVGNAFFDTFLTQEMQPLNSTPAPSILDKIILWQNTSSVLNCTPFETLQKMGRVNDLTCHDSFPSDGSAILVPSLTAVISVVFGLTLVSTF
ncbi:hypothetical protein N7528_008142 [Penicillium herquei]|nr:hypothetical protein N7528_008142 [Penicillium herquei]